MIKTWKSAEAEAHTAKADAFEHAIDVLQTIEELLPDDAGIRQVRATVHLLGVRRDNHRSRAEQASKGRGGE